jgi:release factor glutamine methyltransferase
MSFSTITFEPQLALFTSDDDGLQFYRFFAGNYHQLLSTGGKIFLEIGLQQGEKVAQLFEIAGWRKIEVTKDLSGHDRVISAERP